MRLSPSWRRGGKQKEQAARSKPGSWSGVRGRSAGRWDSVLDVSSPPPPPNPPSVHCGAEAVSGCGVASLRGRRALEGQRGGDVTAAGRESTATGRPPRGSGHIGRGGGAVPHVG